MTHVARAPRPWPVKVKTRHGFGVEKPRLFVREFAELRNGLRGATWFFHIPPVAVQEASRDTGGAPVPQ